MTDLTVCPKCAGEFVFPIAWRESSDTHWEVEIECANCRWFTVGEWDQATVDALDTKLDRQFDLMLAERDRADRERLADDVEWFVEALAIDAILPEDF